MEELSLQRIRDLIIAAHSVSDGYILSFDTTSIEIIIKERRRSHKNYYYFKQSKKLPTKLPTVLN